MCEAFIGVLMETTEERMRVYRDRFEMVAGESEFSNHIARMMTDPKMYRDSY